MIPSRDDVLTTIYTLVSEEQFRRYACTFARFPHECMPGRGASLSEIAAVVVDTASPEVWSRFVDALAEPYKRRPAEIALLRRWTPGGPSRRIFAAVALDGSGVWAIGDSAEEARAGAGDHRAYFRDCARSVDDDFPDASTDTAWLDTLTIVTLSGTTEGLRALIKSMETGDSVAPWCPADLWDYTEPVKEP